MIKPKRYLEYERRTRLFRMKWSLGSTCPICDQDFEYIYDGPPEKIDLVMILSMPCDKCMNQSLKEYEQQEKQKRYQGPRKIRRIR